ncbi:hypothetical protein [uncultured Fibrobacter sp.]|uniref:hypothetical protein n=1 Tax=uncultured Fibrobacter sp. TaxID=261512 RepID=UPI002599D54C|nr:hypothetical protein [uncultured Fibrobacter sp.]
MSNAKERYSETSKEYCEIKVPSSPLDLARYKRCKERERKFNENWKKEKVNIIDMVNRYAPNAKVYTKGYKFYFEGPDNVVICDMVAGYLRIQNKKTKLFYRLDGSLTKSNERTHFKIKRREEM